MWVVSTHDETLSSRCLLSFLEFLDGFSELSRKTERKLHPSSCLELDTASYSVTHSSILIKFVLSAGALDIFVYKLNTRYSDIWLLYYSRPFKIYRSPDRGASSVLDSE